MGMYSEDAKRVRGIHDRCLEYEQGIESYSEELCDRRAVACSSGDKDDFRLIIPALNGIIADAEAYRDYLIGMFSGGGGND